LTDREYKREKTTFCQSINQSADFQVQLLQQIFHFVTSREIEALILFGKYVKMQHIRKMIYLKEDDLRVNHF